MVMAQTLKISMARKIPGARIAAYDEQGYTYILKHRFDGRDSPKLIATLLRIREAGEINLSYWRRARPNEA